MVEPGSRIADFRLHDVAGKPVSLADLQQRGPVILAFFKASCPVCQYALPFLERIAKSGQAPVVGISQDDSTTAQEFREAHGLSFPIWIDSISDGYKVSNAFKITNVPSIFVVEPDGRVSTAFSGFSRRDLAELGHRFHARVFHQGEQTPEFRPG